MAKQSDGNYIMVIIEIWICPGKDKSWKYSYLWEQLLTNLLTYIFYVIVVFSRLIDLDEWVSFYIEASLYFLLDNCILIAQL